jgi:adenylosuccinate lyase
MIGRTHGQHALPITLGFKFAVWASEISRHIERLSDCRNRVLVGKMSGAVGTQAGLGEHASQIQQLVMTRLGIRAAEISTQIVQRDRFAELVCLLALVACSLENFATEIRELQRPEIGEVFESFEAEKQVGSSTMPHKRNPETCERVCGLARIVRSLVIPSLENVVTWHERDLTQSSAERFVFPEACILTDYLIDLMISVVSNLRVDKKRMLQNIQLSQGRAMSEAVMMALTRKGVDRQEAHELLRKLTLRSETERIHFREVLLKDRFICSKLGEREIDEILDPKNYLGTAESQAETIARGKV